MIPPHPEVCATVCNYNGGEALLRCVEALLRQTLPPTEIVVYDNASEDDSVARLGERFPQVRVVSMGENRGPCPARNRALAEADTPWVLQVDDDVILEADCLEKLMAQTSEEDVAAVMPRAVFAEDPTRVHYDGGSFHYVGVMTLRNFFGPRPEGVEAPLDVDAGIAMALLLRRDVLVEMGAYEESYFILFEDHDLSYRLRSRGWRIRLDPGAVVHHDEGTPGISWRRGRDYPWRRTFLHSRNRWTLLLRNHSAAALILGGPGILFYEGVSVAFATLQGNLGAYLKGKIAFVRRVPSILRQRGPIQRARRVSDRRLLGASPLTHAPMVVRGRLTRWAERGIDGLLRLWWRLVRGLLR